MKTGMKNTLTFRNIDFTGAGEGREGRQKTADLPCRLIFPLNNCDTLRCNNGTLCILRRYRADTLRAKARLDETRRV